MSKSRKGLDADQLRAEITNRILDQLDGADAEGWSPPWISMAAQGIPSNAATSRRYRGVNILNLWATAQGQGFESSKWASFRQWKSLGASVRKGERAARVVFYKSLRIEDRDAEDGERVIPLLRYSSVFNADQVEGYADPDAEGFEPPNVAETVAACDAYIAATGADVRLNGGRAYYSPSEDYIGLPERELFTSTEGFYSTSFHELAHWSGHPSRLDRQLTARFGAASYAAEELVAELGAAFQCAAQGIEPEPREDHAQYIAHWIRLLKSDSRAIFTAAARASDAVEYLDGKGE